MGLEVCANTPGQVDTFFFILIYCMYVPVYAVHYSMCVEVRGQSCELVLSFTLWVLGIGLRLLFLAARDLSCLSSLRADSYLGIYCILSFPILWHYGYPVVWTQLLFLAGRLSIVFSLGVIDLNRITSHRETPLVELIQSSGNVKSGIVLYPDNTE